MKYFLFDCETGGPSEEYSLLTLYGLILDNKLGVLDYIDLKMCPDDMCYKVKASALAINGIDLTKHQEDAVPYRVAFDNFRNFLGRYTLHEKLVPAGHNVEFDVRFTKRYLLPENYTSNRMNLGPAYAWNDFFELRLLDTASVARYLQVAGKLPEDLSCSLSSLAEHFSLREDNRHDAKFDVELTRKVLKNLVAMINEDKEQL